MKRFIILALALTALARAAPVGKIHITSLYRETLGPVNVVAPITAILILHFGQN